MHLGVLQLISFISYVGINFALYSVGSQYKPIPNTMSDPARTERDVGSLQAHSEHNCIVLW